MSEQTETRDAAAFTALGTARERVTLPSTTFDGTVNMPVMHQVVKAYLANQRQGTASTKTRGLVVGGNQKPWKQKGTGRARQGSTRAPNWPGGGTVFGPHGDRNYSEDVPRKVKALARRSALNARANEAAIFVIDAFNYSEPRTKLLTSLVSRLGVADRKVLILTDGVKQTVHLSGRNIPNVHVMPYSDASAYHVLWSDVVLIEAPAIGHTLAPIAEKESAPARKAKTATKTATKATPKAKTTAARKPAAKKATAKAASKGEGEATTEKKPAAKKTARKKGE
ncbi:MAG: 50S ribosomal protein L4 [Gemmatimonadaceae bacterium]|nr:50S ribosomal protein L4 [Gemmatimonadaceae bacterium]